VVTFVFRSGKDDAEAQQGEGTVVVPLTDWGQNKSPISMGTGSPWLEGGGPSPSVSGSVLWLLWVLSQIFLLITLEQYCKEFMH